MIQNPYWDEVKSIVMPSFEGGLVVDQTGIQRTMQLAGPNMITFTMREGIETLNRFEFLKRYSFTIPDPASIRFVARMSRMHLIEMGAGTGYWAWILSQIGANIVAFDIAPPDRKSNEYHGRTRTWFPICEDDGSVLRLPTNRTLIVGWPPMHSNEPAQWLKHYRGDQVIFIGQYSEEVCADEEFYDILDEDWVQIGSHRPVRWDLVRDRILVFERTKYLRLGRSVQ